MFKLLGVTVEADYNLRMFTLGGPYGRAAVKSRPININPLSIQLPIMAVVSIIHRLSGMLVFLLLPLLLWALQLSLVSNEGFNQLKDHLSQTTGKSICWLLGSGLVFHMLAGIRHLLMDIKLGDSRCGGRLGAWLVILLATFFILALTYGVWGK